MPESKVLVSIHTNPGDGVVRIPSVLVLNIYFYRTYGTDSTLLLHMTKRRKEIKLKMKSKLKYAKISGISLLILQRLQWNSGIVLHQLK